MAFGTLGAAFDAAKPTAETLTPGLDFNTIMKIAGLASKAMPQQRQEQQPGYQSMVPPQSMVMQPQAMPSSTPLGQTQMQAFEPSQSIMSQAAASKLRQESDSGLGGALGTLAGAGIGFLAGGPAGALTGASVGGELGSSF